MVDDDDLRAHYIEQYIVCKYVRKRHPPWNTRQHRPFY